MRLGPNCNLCDLAVILAQSHVFKINQDGMKENCGDEERGEEAFCVSVCEIEIARGIEKREREGGGKRKSRLRREKGTYNKRTL